MKKKIYKENRFSDFREIINYSAKRFGRRTAFLIKTENGKYRKISYSEFRERYYTFCNKLLSEGLEGKRIAVIGNNCFEWVLSYFCASTVGCAVPLDKELSAEDVKNFADSAECAALIGSESCTEELCGVLPGNIKLMTFSDVFSLSEPNGVIDITAVNGIRILKDEMRVLIFTSGTTGSSKGVSLSQYNICSNVHSTVSVVKIRPKDATLSVLPLHHTYECTLDCILLLSKGAKITYADSLTRIQKNIVEYRPTVLVVVPALLKVLDSRIRAGVIKQCPEKYKKYFETMSFAEAMSKVPFIVRRVIRNAVRRSLGGRMRLFIVGAADLDTELVENFDALGIRTLQGYGLTECSPLLAGNSDFYLNAASTGIAMPGVSLKIDSPNGEGVGEILAKGDNIMLGYYNDKEATARAFRDGWFCTGDLGRMDADGALYIMGRIKNVIVTANGKNIYPEELETRLSQHSEVGEVLVVGAAEKGDVCVKAKILPNLDFIRQTLGRLPTKDDIRIAIQRIILDVNSKIPSYKRIKAVEILESALEKTTTQKIKRCGSNLR